MTEWLSPAIDAIAQWLDFQVRLCEQPGCVLAISQGGRVVCERAFGVADLSTGEALTPRHRFRVASHSKTFTSAAIMKLRDAGALRLDDRIDRFVPGTATGLAGVTLAQLLSHSAGILRDGLDASHWQRRRPFLDRSELQAQLAEPLTLEPNLRFKYSNLGFGLLGMVIEAVTGRAFGEWITREILEPAGLAETAVDMPAPGSPPMAQGHGARLPLGRRTVLTSDTRTHALAAATGFVSTAADLVRFFGQLSPAAPGRLLSVESRREMTRPHWRVPHSQTPRHYGLGTMNGVLGSLTPDVPTWFGHIGGFPGTITRTVAVPDWDIAVSILTNAVDGRAVQWIDGALHILEAFARHGAPDAAVADWTGRWWSLWGAQDLVPIGRRVFVSLPAEPMPLLDCSEIEVTGPTSGRIAVANGYASHGETVRRSVSGDGQAERLWLGGIELLPEADFAAELTRGEAAGGRR